MVLLGGLEVVAAGYLIHKHQQNKKDRKRLEEEAAALEEQQYRIFPNDKRHSSHNSRHGHRRRHSADGRYKQDGRHKEDGRYRRDDGRPNMSGASTEPVATLSRPQAQSQPIAPHPQPTMAHPPPYASVVPPQVMQAYPAVDMKYGWTDDSAHGHQQQASDVVTGWPAHWEQSQTSLNTGARLQPPQDGRRGDRERGRETTRARSAQPHVRFANSVSSVSRSPPPGYRSGSRR